MSPWKRRGSLCVRGEGEGELVCVGTYVRPTLVSVVGVSLVVIHQSS